ncbi:hypothetical protein [Blautia hansenii]|uniref:hypothetical protein n=1 Tax=Blautia hansenii TaxID=1322 RepID=UPI0039844699
MRKKLVALIVATMCFGTISGCSKESDTAKESKETQNNEVSQENKEPENIEKSDDNTSIPKIEVGEKFLVETEMGSYNFTLKDVITPDISSLDLPVGKKMIVITFNVENIDFGEGTDTKLLLNSEAFKVSDENNTLLSTCDFIPSDVEPPQLLESGYNQDTGIPYLIDKNSKSVNIVLSRKSGDLCKATIKLNENNQFDVSDLQLNLEIEISDNWAQIKGTYVNNSDYTIKNLIITYIDKATNETEYFGSYDTVLPGETSPISKGDTIDNKEVSLDTLEAIKYQIKAVNENEEEQTIIYDVKLDQYEVY